ncbi:hypothetical protein [Cryobacterium sp. SO1]|uniref:hypothetical protein n=1 Tax=Cryobacterium sp. SO1 TaxID=1897061 RepID=UPI0010239750|nr:hypothetical protein [Cryobacterium sp. SO1]RZI34025.1 hypothetical protein BJQ95_03608 [Cryobacterium sp. SO1]
MTTATIPTVTIDDHHVTVPTTPPKLIVKLDDASSSSNVTDNTAEQIQARATRLAPHIDEKRDQIAYWEAVRAAQVESGTATGYDRSTVKKGDRVKIRGQWREVVRANLKTVSVTTGYTWTDTAPYAEVQQLVRPE